MSCLDFQDSPVFEVETPQDHIKHAILLELSPRPARHLLKASASVISAVPHQHEGFNRLFLQHLVRTRPFPNRH